jgi:hypothetical protein
MQNHMGTTSLHKEEPETQKITGLITYVNLSGRGPNSAQLVFVVRSSEEEVVLTVTSYPTYEPQIFTCYSQLVTSAHFAKSEVTAYYMAIPDQLGQIVSIVSS